MYEVVLLEKLQEDRDMRLSIDGLPEYDEPLDKSEALFISSNIGI
jgi:hypothetical protein